MSENNENNALDIKLSKTKRRPSYICFIFCSCFLIFRLKFDHKNICHYNIKPYLMTLQMSTFLEKFWKCLTRFRRIRTQILWKLRFYQKSCEKIREVFLKNYAVRKTIILRFPRRSNNKIIHIIWNLRVADKLIRLF